MTAPQNAMVLAAGFGTRMGELTRSRPKPLLQVAGKTLIDHTLDILAAAGVGHAVVNLHYLGVQIRDHLASRTVPPVTFSEEQPEILDTGGGVTQALPDLGPEPFLTINSDAIFHGANPVEVLASAWRPETMDALLLLVPVDRAISYTRAGDFFLEQDAGTPRRRDAAASAPYVFAGAQIIRPEAYKDPPQGAFSNNLIWDRLLTEGRLSAVVYPGRWADVGTAEGLSAAETLLADG